MSTVLLLHAGIADSRMWEPQAEALRGAGFHVLSPDLRGFGEHALEPGPFSHARDAEALLVGPTAVVGGSLGGRVALELAVLRPELVERLVVIAPGLAGWSWSDETRAGWAAEEAAFEEGNFDAAAEASVRLWIDGPRRSPDEVDPVLRSAVREMTVRSYDLQQGIDDDEESPLDPAINERLAEIGCPTLVLVGEEDVADMQGIAAHVASSIADARLVTIPGASHLPGLERPELVNPLLLEFLSEG